MDKHDIISEIGQFSYYQRIIALTILFTNIPAAFSMMMMAFGGTIPDWTCSVSDEAVIDLNTTNVCPMNGTECKRIFLTEMETVINEWDLVCDKRWVGFTITSIQMAGVLVGSLVAGYISDVFGRKKTLYGSQLVLFVMNVVNIFSPSWQVFAGLRFVVGLALGGIMTVNFPLAMEFVGPRWRSILGAIPAFSLGCALMPLVLWLTPQWYHFEVSCAVLSFISLLGWFYVPESIRWLAVKGKIDEAEKIISNIARRNKKPTPDMKVLRVIYEEEIFHSKGKSYSYLDLFRTKDMAKRTLILSVAWMSQSMTFFCVALGVQNLAGNLFLNMFLLTIVEMPSHLIVLLSANTVGRRWSVAGFYYATGLLGLGAALATLYAPDSSRGSIVNACAMLANLCVGTSWTVMMVFTTEQYPTVIRNLGYGVGNMMARLGAIFSSQIVALAADGAYIPYVIITVLMVLSGSLVLTLSETRGTALLDSLQNSEKKEETTNLQNN
ncbi:solute carrier family 22 member 4 [Patella vulgata]|uniref:solute carrier family 22 member 4 n=1 Tax=Patella vulgata TaxID=6465 RepID=UPI00217FE554|nr:solute carrier family 22 member 4 [Patella vulgata]XP_050392907.1 solute carrier family 22 member 4 [Patella vulgata]